MKNRLFSLLLACITLFLLSSCGTNSSDGDGGGGGGGSSKSDEVWLIRKISMVSGESASSGWTDVEGAEGEEFSAAEITFSYDESGLMEQICASGEGKEETIPLTYSFDRDGRVSEFVMEGTRLTFSYHENGNIAEKNQYIDEELTVTERYYESGKRERYTHFSRGEKISDHRYRENGHLFESRVYGGDGGSGTRYDEDGLPTEQFSLDGETEIDLLVLQYRYDQNGNPVQATLSNGDSALRLEFVCDEDGNVIEMTEYNGAGEKVSFTRTDKNGRTLETKSYSHGELRRRVTYEYDDNDRLKKFLSTDNSVLSGYEYNYDKNGNVSEIILYKNGTTYRLTVEYEKLESDEREAFVKQQQTFFWSQMINT